MGVERAGPNQTVRVNITMTQAELEELDRMAEQLGKSRSGLLREGMHLVRAQLQQQRRQGSEKPRRTPQEVLESILKNRVPAGDWDPVAIIRKFRETP